MARKDDVEYFLNEFQTLAKVFDLKIANRDKNTQALLDLGITQNIRKDVILNLKYDNYYRGPSKDRNLLEYDLWEFGAILPNGKEVYIKLSCRKEKSRVVCVSFHEAKHKITYPLRKK